MSAVHVVERPATTGTTSVLVVDLDGTLVRTDTLFESVLCAFRTNPLRVFAAVATLAFCGKAAFKDALAQCGHPDPTHLPYNHDLVAFLAEQKALGRRIVLATASNRRFAEAVARHLGLFDEVIASDSQTNLKGDAKRRVLVERFGRGGFCYASDHASDLTVWRDAGAAVACTPERLRRRIECPVEKTFPPAGGKLRAFVKAVRPHQWTKNLLVFAPLIAAGDIARSALWLNGLAAFVAFSLMASGVYLLNDMLDLEADRRHPRKRRRPFASGVLPLSWGYVGAPALILTALALSAATAPALAGVLLLYALLTTAYSAYLKILPLVDSFLLAALYSLRAFAGGLVTEHIPSTWFISFTGSLFLSLAFLKRFVEATKARPADGRILERRGYSSEESAILATTGIAAAFTSATLFALWLDRGLLVDAAPFRNEIIWLLAPLTLFWTCRMWLSAARGYVDDDPIVYAAGDRVTWAVFGLGGVIYVASLAF